MHLRNVNIVSTDEIFKYVKETTFLQYSYIFNRFYRLSDFVTSASKNTVTLYLYYIRFRICSPITKERWQLSLTPLIHCRISS